MTIKHYIFYKLLFQYLFTFSHFFKVNQLQKSMSFSVRMYNFIYFSIMARVYQANL